MVKNKTYVGEEQYARGNFSVSFSFWTYKKKYFTQKPILAKKTLFQQDLVDANTFWAKMGFCVKCFFCMFKTKRKMGNRIWRFVPHLHRFSFLPKQNYIHEAESRGLFSRKIVNKWTMSWFSFRRYIFPEEWSEKNNVFVRSAIEGLSGLCNVIFISLLKT